MAEPPRAVHVTWEDMRRHLEAAHQASGGHASDTLPTTVPDLVEALPSPPGEHPADPPQDTLPDLPESLQELPSDPHEDLRLSVQDMRARLQRLQESYQISHADHTGVHPDTCTDLPCIFQTYLQLLSTNKTMRVLAKNRVPWIWPSWIWPWNKARIRRELAEVWSFLLALPTEVSAWTSDGQYKFHTRCMGRPLLNIADGAASLFCKLYADEWCPLVTRDQDPDRHLHVAIGYGTTRHHALAPLYRAVLGAMEHRAVPAEAPPAYC
jgi:hypothetical protein